MPISVTCLCISNQSNSQPLPSAIPSNSILLDHVPFIELPSSLLFPPSADGDMELSSERLQMHTIKTVGGMVLVCSINVSMQLIHSSDSQIDVLISDRSRKFDWLLSAMYGCPYKVKKHELKLL